MQNANGHAIEVLGAELRAFKDLMDERDRRYEERYSAAEKAVVAALTAQKEAVIKAEDGQRTYNAGHNDLARKLDSQAKEFPSRAEVQTGFLRIDEKIEEIKKELASLRESRSVGTGKDEAKTDSGVLIRWAIPVIIMVVSVLWAVFKN